MNFNLNFLRNIAWKILKYFYFLFKIRTFGVRALVIRDDKVLLVTHTYINSWYIVGGGVDKGETAMQAIKRELMEEAGVRCISPPKLYGVYHNTISMPDDHVCLYIVNDFVQTQVSSPEILKAEWFPLANIPADTSSGTRRRIEEYLGMSPIREEW